METNYTNQLTQKRSVFSVSVIPFLLLCGYFVVIMLQNVEGLPESLNSLFLYGFVGTAALCVLLSGKFSVSFHNIWYALFVIICLISCLYSASIQNSVYTVIEVVKLLLFAVMFTNTVNNEKRMRISLAVIAVTVLVFFLYLLQTDQLEVEERLGQSLIGNANAFASLFMVGTVCSVYFVYFSRNHLFKVLSVAMFLAQMYALSLSGGRKFFLLPLLLLCAVLIVQTDKKGRKRIIRNAVIAVSLLLLTFWAIYNVEFLYESIGHRMEGLFNLFTEKGKADYSTIERQKLIELGIDIWKESPLLGHGISTFAAISNTKTYSHNNYVELLCGVGLIGMLFYYTFHVYLIMKLYNRKEMGTERLYWAALILLLAVFDVGAVSYNMYPVHFLLLLANCALHNPTAGQQQKTI